MAARKPPRDTRLNVARYQVDRLKPAADEDDEDQTDNAGQTTMEQFAGYVEISIQQAMRRGDFDDLPGARKPLTNLHQTYDPNWWIRQKLEREHITGLGPPALTLRTESATLHERLDAAPSEQAARELLEDFNHRVIEARRQLLGGPPVVTPTRDVDDELAQWRQRRDDRLRAAAEARDRAAAELAAMSRAERRRLKRAQDRRPRSSE